MPFPEVVRRLIETGVEYYHVDYVARRKTFYSAEGDAVVTSISYEDLPSVAPDFDGERVRAASWTASAIGSTIAILPAVRWRLACA
jgi:hypothetical protein